MLFYVLFACFLSSMTTEAQTVLATGAPEMTETQQNLETPPDDTFEVHTGVTDQPTPAALEEIATTFYKNELSIPQTEESKGSTAKQTTDKNDIRSSTASETPNLSDQNGETASKTVSSTLATTPTTILSTTSTFVSSVPTRNGPMQTESAAMTDSPLKLTTRVLPTAKLSATTEAASEKLTTESTGFVRQSPTAQLTTEAQKTTTKLAKTSVAIVPPVITTISSQSDKEDDQEKAVKHGKIVAGLIGGALIAMMIGFLVILYKKHKLKKHQIATTDWAGPTPFLETGAGNNGNVSLRSANRISLAGFLPQRLSKRLSLLAESGEEMRDMHELTTASTFAGKEEKKVEKNGTKVDKTVMSAAKEAAVNKSEAPTKVEIVVVVDEVKENGEIKNKEDQSGQAEVEKGENGVAENTPTQSAAAETPPKQSNDENKEETGKEGADNVL